MKSVAFYPKTLTFIAADLFGQWGVEGIQLYKVGVRDGFFLLLCSLLKAHTQCWMAYGLVSTWQYHCILTIGMPIHMPGVPGWYNSEGKKTNSADFLFLWLSTLCSLCYSSCCSTLHTVLYVLYSTLLSFVQFALHSYTTHWFIECITFFMLLHSVNFI